MVQSKRCCGCCTSATCSIMWLTLAKRLLLELKRGSERPVALSTTTVCLSAGSKPTSASVDKSTTWQPRICWGASLELTKKMHKSQSASDVNAISVMSLRSRGHNAGTTQSNLSRIPKQEEQCGNHIDHPIPWETHVKKVSKNTSFPKQCVHTEEFLP